jgi:hypothetical protein
MFGTYEEKKCFQVGDVISLGHFYAIDIGQSQHE